MKKRGRGDHCKECRKNQREKLSMRCKECNKKDELPRRKN